MTEHCLCRFTHIVLDRVKVSINNVGSTFITVLYLATLEGVIHKLAVFPAGIKADDATEGSLVCLVEAISLNERSKPGLVRSLQLHTAKVCFSLLVL